MYAQGYFSYDSRSRAVVTISHLRFGKTDPGDLLINQADYIATHNQAYVNEYDVLPV